VNVTESISRVVLEEMVYEVTHETEPIAFEDTISEPEFKDWIQASDTMSIQYMTN
jgi:hypothetical protein